MVGKRRFEQFEEVAAELDPGFAPFDACDELFVEVVAPLRLAWLDRLRHRPDADLSVTGSWLVCDSREHWLVLTDGIDVSAYHADADTRADCRLTAFPGP